MRVGDQNVAVRPIDMPVGLPMAWSGVCQLRKEVAVGVEDLDAGGHVDDVELIFAVDGHRPRLLQAAVGDAAAPPDRFQSPGGSPVAVAALHRSQGGSENDPEGSL